MPLSGQVHFKLLSGGYSWDTSVIQTPTESECQINYEDLFQLKAVVREVAFAIGVQITRTESHDYDENEPDWSRAAYRKNETPKTALVIDAQMVGYKKYPQASLYIDHETPLGKILFFKPERDCKLTTSE